MPVQTSTQCAVAITVQLRDQDDSTVAASLTELTKLAATLGITITETITQKRDALGTHYLGEGKLRELAESIAAENDDPIDCVIVDGELSPGQQRAMALALGVVVLDRTGVILRIFEQRAQTPLAKLEVEIARLMYELPRLRDDEALVDKQGGGAGRGERGHTSVELAKQQMRQRLAKLRWSLEQQPRTNPHANKSKRMHLRREDAARVALVGYTNAGKSSLMRALTGSHVLVEDKLFATLGVTTRALHPESRPKVRVTDTVGFIQRLPHDLVASFRSTLEEARDASMLLLVVDASDPAFRSQLQVTAQTLESVGIHAAPLLVLNKIDRVSTATRIALAAEFPHALAICAHNADDIALLRSAILNTVDRGMSEATLEVPFSQSAFTAEIRSRARIVEEQYTESATILRVRASADCIARWRTALM